MKKLLNYLLPLVLGYVGGTLSDLWRMPVAAQQKGEEVKTLDVIRARRIELVDEDGVLLGGMATFGNRSRHTVTLWLGSTEQKEGGEWGGIYMSCAFVDGSAVVEQTFDGGRRNERLKLQSRGMRVEVAPQKGTAFTTEVFPDRLQVRRNGTPQIGFGLSDGSDSALFYMSSEQNVPMLEMRVPSDQEKSPFLRFIDRDGKTAKTIDNKP